MIRLFRQVRSRGERRRSFSGGNFFDGINVDLILLSLYLEARRVLIKRSVLVARGIYI